MICPNCLEDYRFVRFESHPERVGPRAIFNCDCELPTILAVEICERQDMLDDDQLEQLFQFKLLSMRRTLEQQRKLIPEPARSSQIPVRLLKRYLEEVSLQTLKPIAPRPANDPPPTKK